jgi:hypothetical protein
MLGIVRVVREVIPSFEEIATNFGLVEKGFERLG